MVGAYTFARMSPFQFIYGDKLGSRSGWLAGYGVDPCFVLWCCAALHGELVWSGLGLVRFMGDLFWERRRENETLGLWRWRCRGVRFELGL